MPKLYRPRAIRAAKAETLWHAIYPIRPPHASALVQVAVQHGQRIATLAAQPRSYVINRLL